MLARKAPESMFFYSMTHRINFFINKIVSRSAHNLSVQLEPVLIPKSEATMVEYSRWV